MIVIIEKQLFKKNAVVTGSEGKKPEDHWANIRLAETVLDPTPSLLILEMLKIT